MHEICVALTLLNERPCEGNWEFRWNEDKKSSGDSSGKHKAYGDKNITKLREESNPEKAADIIGEVLYTFYRRLKKGNETYLLVIKTSGDCFRKLIPQVSGLESSEDTGVLEQLCHSKSLGNGEILEVKNVNVNVSEPVPPGLEILPIKENQTDGRSFGYNYTNVFERILSKYNKYCCFAFGNIILAKNQHHFILLKQNVQ